MWDDVLFDVVLWTTIIVAIWYGRREQKVIRTLLREHGVELERLTSPTGPPTAPPRIEPDVEVPSARVLATAEGHLRLSADALIRDRPGQSATVLLGLLRPDGTAFPHPAGARWCRFEDGSETLGGSVRTPPAARSHAYWHDLGQVVRRGDVPLPDGPFDLGLRIEVWIDGRKEASALLHQGFLLGSRGPPEPAGEVCVACGRPGAERHCPRCREPHHEICLELNRGCTRLACAARNEDVAVGEDPRVR